MLQLNSLTHTSAIARNAQKRLQNVELNGRERTLSRTNFTYEHALHAEDYWSLKLLIKFRYCTFRSFHFIHSSFFDAANVINFI